MTVPGRAARIASARLAKSAPALLDTRIGPAPTRAISEAPSLRRARGEAPPLDSGARRAASRSDAGGLVWVAGGAEPATRGVGVDVPDPGPTRPSDPPSRVVFEPRPSPPAEEGLVGSGAPATVSGPGRRDSPPVPGARARGGAVVSRSAAASAANTGAGVGRVGGFSGVLVVSTTGGLIAMVADPSASGPGTGRWRPPAR